MLNLPTYDYRCQSCNLSQEVTHGFDSRPVVPCQLCNAPMIKGFTASAIHFRGKGFYSTDK
ncbi:MAG: FmdB family zinc ribbon protein [Terrimicrobiaceae bacterium]